MHTSLISGLRLGPGVRGKLSEGQRDGSLGCVRAAGSLDAVLVIYKVKIKCGF